MKRKSIYLDTSIINFLFADDEPEKKEITLEFFEHYVKPGVHHVFISQIVTDEITRTKDAHKRELLMEAIDNYSIELLEIERYNDELSRLSQIYIDKGIIPNRKLEDALHIAVTTVFELDILLSWNYRHLSNVNKEARIHVANYSEGYTKPIRMITPLEVIYHELY